jgi:hypothetical protein
VIERIGAMEFTTAIGICVGVPVAFMVTRGEPATVPYVR